MQNLASSRPGAEISTTATVRTELEAAGVPVLQAAFVAHGDGWRPEVQSTVVGVLTYAQAVVVFERAWYYYRVNATKNMPHDRAYPLNVAWGDIVRVNGMSGGDSVPRSGCQSWHVDSELGLKALVEALDLAFGERSAKGVTIAELLRRRLIREDVYRPAEEEK